VKIKEDYQISKIIRDMSVFAKQNVVSDPPFSNMDLVACRNVLIYLDQSAQKRIIPIFHFALRPSGFLVLGKSEGIGEFSDFFAVTEKTYRIFSKKPLSRLPHFERYVVPKSKSEPSLHPVIQKDSPGVSQVTLPRISNEIDQALLSSSVIPACVVVDARMEILQFRGDLLPYLEFPKGKATLNLLKIAKEDLMIELRSAVTKAKKENHIVFMGDVYVGEGNQQIIVDIEVIPLKPSVSKEQHLLVIFHQQKVVKKDEGSQSKAGKHNRPEERRLLLEKERLQKQLEIVKEQLRSVIEEHEATNEEFQSANEEILSSNEELQSFNEEIETTKEELQSTNEELITVNDELQLRNAELGVTNSALLNVLSSSNVPIIIVDNQLLIRRVTPVTKKSFRIIAADVGRSIGDIKLPIKFPDLRKIILEVIDMMESKSEEVVDEQGDWYTLWVRPYHTLDDKIDGAIITLMDINEIKLSQIAQQGNLSYIEGILGTMREPLVVLDNQFRVMNANNAFYVKFRISRKETEGISFYELGNKEWDTPQLRELLEKVLPEKNFLEDIEIECDFPQIGGSMVLCVNAHRLIHQDPNKDCILLVMEDITERKFVQDRTDTFMSMASHELKTPATTIKMLVQILQKRFGKDEDKTFVEYLEKISEQVNSLTKISSDLLDVSGIRAGKFVLNEELFVFCPLAREIVENCQLLTDTHTIILEGEKTTMMKGDRERIGRVFINLIVNAIKYSPKGDKVIVKISHAKECLTVSVQDFGIGIAVENQKKIFDHSTQVTREKGQHSSGLGLGLYISSTIVQRHGGRIWVESTEGKGSIFFFTLPIPVIDQTDENKE
jgi:two-component system CheB/CheR fusion protein